MKAVYKLARRTIRSFRGRYLALLLIVTLSVGFFSGLKITKDAMANTCQQYLDEQRLYDYRLISTAGFPQQAVEQFAQLSFVETAEGSYSLDAMAQWGEDLHPLHLLSLPEEVSLPSLTAGRLPEADGECLADSAVFDPGDIGTVIHLTDEEGAAPAGLTGTEYTIVGLADSPQYLGIDRGTTSIGSGMLRGFFYLPASAFTSPVYTEIQLTLTQGAPLYSEEYDQLIEEHAEEIAALCRQVSGEWYQTLLAQSGLTAEQAAQGGLAAPQNYVLTRAENSGYISFENDTSILSGIANIFPLFFILIALLVCITTMTRMVDEERTQIGVLKALGYSDGAITAKYLIYAGSATLIGWCLGFFSGTWMLPQVFWYAYRSLYDFAPLSYLFSPALAGLTLAVALIAILGSTYLSCRKELGSQPAALLRPRAAKSGNRILLERVGFLWRRLTFLQKITLRNMFRYKRRLVMMLVGISCCAGLVVTAFGVRDSMIDTGTLQFDTVQQYDMEITFQPEDAADMPALLAQVEGVEDALLCSLRRTTAAGGGATLSVGLYTLADSSALDGYWDLHDGDNPVAFPGTGEAVVGRKVAQALSLTVGDTLEIRDSGGQNLTVTVSGIFDNYVDNFVLLSAGTEGALQPDTALLHTSGDGTATAERLTALPAVTGVTQLSVTRDHVDSALSCLDYIIWLIVLFAAALAFIVIFNLTNINLAERSREIATVQVLGFYPRETESYVLRENLVLSVLASIIGLPLGALFHRIVMHMIAIDSMVFHTRIAPVSFVLALVLTVLFAAVVNLFMRRRIGRIHMAESLKAVE